MRESDSPLMQMTDPKKKLIELHFFEQHRAKNYVLRVLLPTAFFLFCVLNYTVEDSN